MCHPPRHYVSTLTVTKPDTSNKGKAIRQNWSNQRQTRADQYCHAAILAAQFKDGARNDD